MAKLSTKHKGLDGMPVRPVARVRVTLPLLPGEDDSHEPLVWRLTLRSDGSILRAHRLPASQYGPASWTGHAVWAAAPATPTMSLEEYKARFADRVLRYLSRRYGAGVTVTPEAL